MKTSSQAVAAWALLVILPASVPGATPPTAPADSPTARRIISNSLGMELVHIEPGEFFMGIMSREKTAATYGGGEGDYAQEEPLHWVQISEGFWMGRTEVTRGQFRRFVEETGYQTTADQRGYAGGFTKDGWGWVKGLNWQSPKPMAGITNQSIRPTIIPWYRSVGSMRRNSAGGSAKRSSAATPCPPRPSGNMPARPAPRRPSAGVTPSWAAGTTPTWPTRRPSGGFAAIAT